MSVGGPGVLAAKVASDFAKVGSRIESHEYDAAKKQLNSIENMNYGPLSALYWKYRALVEYHASEPNLNKWALYSFMCLMPRYARCVADYQAQFCIDAAAAPELRVDVSEWKRDRENPTFVFPISISAGFEDEFFFADKSQNLIVVVENSLIQALALKSLSLIIRINHGEKTPLVIEEDLVLSTTSRVFYRKSLTPEENWKTVEIDEATITIGNLTVVLPLSNRVFPTNLHHKMTQIAHLEGYHVNVKYPLFGIVGVKPLLLVEVSADEGKIPGNVNVYVNNRQYQSGTVESGQQTTLQVLLEEEMETNVHYDVSTHIEIGGIPCEPVPITSFDLAFHNPFAIECRGLTALKRNFSATCEVQITAAVQIPIEVKSIVFDCDESLVDVSAYPVALPMFLNPGECLNAVASVRPLKCTFSPKSFGTMTIKYFPSQYFEDDCSYEFHFPAVKIRDSPIVVDFHYPSTVSQYQPEEMEIVVRNVTSVSQNVNVRVADSSHVMIDGYTDVDITIEPNTEETVTLIFFALNVGECRFPAISVGLVNDKNPIVEEPDLFVIYTGN